MTHARAVDSALSERNDINRIFATGDRTYNRRERTVAFLVRVRRDGVLDRINQRHGRCVVCDQRITVARDGAIRGHARDCIVCDYESLPLVRRQRSKYPSDALRAAGYVYNGRAWKKLPLGQPPVVMPNAEVVERLGRILAHAEFTAAMSRKCSDICAKYGPGRVVGGDGKTIEPRPTEEAERDCVALTLALRALSTAPKRHWTATSTTTAATGKHHGDEVGRHG